MNAHSPASFTNPDRMDRGKRSIAALIAEADEILTRTLRIVDRLCPALPFPQFSTRYPELNSGIHYVMRHGENARQRDRLHRLIRPRIEAKVRGRSA